MTTRAVPRTSSLPVKAASAMAVMLYGLSACGGSSDTATVTQAAPTSSETTTATSPGTVTEYDTTYDIATPTYDGKVVDAYGKESVDLAVAKVTALITKLSFQDEVISRDFDPANCLNAKSYMTPHMRDEFDKGIQEATKKPKKIVATIGIICYYGIQGITFNEGPKAVNPKISAMSASTNGKFLLVKATTKAQMRLLDGGKPVTLPLTKTVTYFMSQSEVGGPWLVDGLRGDYLGGNKYKPEKQS